MLRTLALFAVALASIAAAAVTHLLRPRPAPRGVEVSSAAGPLRLSAQLDHRYFDAGGGKSPAYLQLDLTAAGDPSAARRVPVNAVLILDRSGSMSGAKIERARDAARALVQSLGESDRLAVIEFSSDASVLLASAAVDATTRARALAAIDGIVPMGGTNMSHAFDVAAPELRRGAARGRVDKVFLASDGQANEGVSDRAGLLRLAAADFGSATLSTFGMGEDYDEDLMAALAAQAGGRARYIDSPQMLPAAFRDELSRASTLVARKVRVHVGGDARAIGYTADDGGWIRLPDFAAGEERRVIYKFELSPRSGATQESSIDLRYEDAAGREQSGHAIARAQFTADAALLAQPPGEAAVNGARAEMAERADAAARLQESGRAAEAKAQVVQLRNIALKAARAAPARAAEMQSAAEGYADGVAQIDAPGGAASKSLKQKAFDAVRAPVAGW